MTISRVTGIYVGVLFPLTLSILAPTEDLQGPGQLLVIVLGVVGVVAALPSLLLLGVPLYFFGNIALGDPFFLSGSLLLFAACIVLSVIANAALLEWWVRRYQSQATRQPRLQAAPSQGQ